MAPQPERGRGVTDMLDEMNADLLINVTLASCILTMWLVTGAILWFRRHEVPKHYWLVWGAATALGVLQSLSILHAALPQTFPGPNLFVNGVLRGISLTLLLAFLVWSATHSEREDVG